METAMLVTAPPTPERHPPLHRSGPVERVERPPYTIVMMTTAETVTWRRARAARLRRQGRTVVSSSNDEATDADTKNHR